MIMMMDNNDDNDDDDEYFGDDHDDDDDVTGMMAMMMLNIKINQMTYFCFFLFLQVEPWYGTEYSCEQIPEDLIKTWEACGRREELRLPEANPVIATVRKKNTHKIRLVRAKGEMS